MTFGDVTEFLKVLTAMDYVKFFSVLAVIVVGFFVWLAKHKNHSESTVAVAKTEVGKAGILAVAAVIIASIWK